MRAAALAREVLRSAGFRPSKRLGQHFLLDDRGILSFISAFREIRPSEALEVGPGPGSLTFEASRLVDRIVAVDIDPRLVRALAERAPPNVAVVHGDGVAAARSWPLSFVYSNTPFNLSSMIIEAIARNNNVAAAVLGVQKEVAFRMTAGPGSHDYSRLSILSTLVFDVKLHSVIPAEWFTPPPKVDAAVVILRRRRKWNPLLELTLSIAACAFTQKRRKALKVLARCLAQLNCRADALEGLEGRRVWELAPEDLLRVAETCSHSRCESAART